MKNKFGNRYTRAIATFHFHKFVQMFRRTFSLILSFILFSCVRSGKQENTTRKRKHRPSFTELCNGQHGSATEQNHHLKRLSSEILIGENNFRYFARRKHKYASSSTIDKAGKFSIKLPRIKGSLAQYTMEFAIATTVMKTRYMMYAWANFL